MRYDPWPDEQDPTRLRRMADAYRKCGDALAGRAAFETDYCAIRAEMADKKADEIEAWRQTGAGR